MQIKISQRVSTKAVILIASILVHAAGHLHAADIAVDISKRFQTIEGFGTCLTTYGNTDKWLQSVDLPKLYLEELGATCLRINLRGHDIPKQADPSQLSFQDMTLTSRAAGFLREAKRLVKSDPGLRVIGTAMTPPSWMKFNNAETGYPFTKGARKQQSSAISGRSYQIYRTNVDDTNRVIPEYYPHFASWCVEVVRFYESHGVRLYGFSLGNEVCFSQYFGSCVWTAGDYAAAAKLIGEAFAREGLQDVRLYGPETMSQRDARSVYYLDALKANGGIRYLHALATHGYVAGVEGEISESSSAKQGAIAKRYGVKYWATEGGSGGHKWPAPITSGVGVAIHYAMVAGDAALFAPWQFAGDRADQHVLRLHNAATKKTWTAAQFFRFVRRDMHRVEALASENDLLSSAYVDDNGQLVLVVINNGKRAYDTQVTMHGVSQNGSVAKLYRTSAREDMLALPDVSIAKAQCQLKFPAKSISTLVTQHVSPELQQASGDAADLAERESKAAAVLAKARTWNDATGKHSIHATFIKVADGSVVLQKEDGGRIMVPLERLSDKDRRLLEKVRRKDN